MSRSISKGPLEFEITRVDCTRNGCMSEKKSISPDQTQHSTAPDQGVHSLLKPVCKYSMSV